MRTIDRPDCSSGAPSPEKPYQGPPAAERRSYTWTARRLGILLWACGCGALFIAVYFPFNFRAIRLFVVGASPILWLMTLFLFLRGRVRVAGLVVSALLVSTLIALPGRPINPADLREQYVQSLKKYEGTPYVWGGENGRGIDCSGLVRRGLVDALRRVAMATANPLPARIGLDVWWHDCSALALRDQYRDFTRLLFTAPEINTVDPSLLLPGDLAVTSGGVHVLVYLGNQEWIQAEPGLMKVITLAVPQENPWFNVPVHIMRWKNLAGKELMQGAGD